MFVEIMAIISKSGRALSLLGTLIVLNFIASIVVLIQHICYKRKYNSEIKVTLIPFQFMNDIKPFGTVV